MHCSERMSTESHMRCTSPPPSLTERLLSDLEMQGVSFDNGSFFDSACGGGAFLAPIALRIRAALKAQDASPSRILTYVEQNLFGMDIDSTLCALSHQFLKITLHEEIRAAGWEPTFRIITGNSLCDLETFFGSIDVLVCNPPYRKMNKSEIEKYRDNFEEIIQGQPNMYGLFIALSIKLLKQNGVCALVTPTSFLSGQYFSKLRGFLMNEAQVLSIGMVSDRSGVFIDVLQETALTLLRRTSSARTLQTKATVSVVSRDGSYLVDPEKPGFRLPLWASVAEPDQPAFGSTVCRRLTDALHASTNVAKPVYVSFFRDKKT